MKTKLMILGMILALGALFSACDDNDNEGNNNGNLEKTVLNKYPNAENIAWSKSKDNKYDIATFTLPVMVKAVTEADTVQMWFGQQESIRLVNQEISFKSLPEAVQLAFRKTKCSLPNGVVDALLLNTLYADSQIWETDDVYKLERDGAVSYKMEMEAIATEAEINLYYDEQGILLKEAAENEEEAPLEIPESIKKWIDANHKDAEVLDYEGEKEDGEIEHELDLRNGKIVLEITLLEKNSSFELTEEEYNYPSLETLPQDILAKARELLETITGMAEEDIDEITMEKEQTSEVYVIELEKGEQEITIEIIKDAQEKITGKVEREE